MNKEYDFNYDFEQDQVQPVETPNRRKLTRTERNVTIALGSLIALTAIIVPVVLVTVGDGGNGNGNPSDIYIEAQDPGMPPIVTQEQYHELVSEMDFSKTPTPQGLTEDQKIDYLLNYENDTRALIENSVVFNPDGTATLVDNAFSMERLGPDGQPVHQAVYLPEGFRLPDNLTTIGSKAFYMAHLPEDFNLPRSVKFIEPYAFENMRVPMSMTLPDGIELIDHEAFSRVDLPYNFTVPRNAILSYGSKNASFMYIREYSMEYTNDAYLFRWYTPLNTGHQDSLTRPQNPQTVWDIENHRR